MTKSMPVTLEHVRLRELATRLGGLHRDDPQILDLVTSLFQIGCGIDANEALRVKRSKGHDLKKEARHLSSNLAVAWTASAMNPLVDGGLGLSKADAVDQACTHFGLDQAHLERLMRKHKAYGHSGVFSMNGAMPSTRGNQK